MCHIAHLARGSCASPANPLPTVASVHRSRKWAGLIADHYSAPP